MFNLLVYIVLSTLCVIIYIISFNPYDNFIIIFPVSQMRKNELQRV